MSQPTGTPYAIVTGGGTAGHVLPAIAVAEALVARGHDPGTLHYAGAQRGIETRLLPETPFPHVFYDVVGFQRSWSRRNLGLLPKLWRARRDAIVAMRRARPRVVVSVGGYASMPVVLAARKLRVPIVVVSYDLRPGRASQVTARFAAACAVAFPDSPLPNATVTGAPVRQAVLDVDRSEGRTEARERLGLPVDRFVIAVMGGSQGSGALNEVVGRMLPAHADDRGLAIRHVVGERFFPGAHEALAGGDGLLYQPVGYEPDMPSVYAAADLLIGRGGASTVHEVAVTGIPAILVPWAASAEDHQTLNVTWLSERGGAVHLPESDLEHLADIVEQLRNDPEERSLLGQRAREAGAIHRRGALAELIESVAGA